MKVTQLEASQHQDFVAPPGCLQYNFGKTLGTVQNFNFKVATGTQEMETVNMLKITVQDSSSFHLSSQRYSICWRRERGFCSLCFTRGFFGLSNVPSVVSPQSCSTTTSPAPWTQGAGG